MYPSRVEASNAGHRKFFTGRPCSRGHVAPRYVTTGNCIECAKGYTAQFKARHNLGRVSNVVTLELHPDDHEAIYVMADYLNQARGLPPVVRPVQAKVDTRTPWEVTYDLRKRAGDSDDKADGFASARHARTNSESWSPFGAPQTVKALQLAEELAANAPRIGGGNVPEVLR
jgi:hypothetical protein